MVGLIDADFIKYLVIYDLGKKYKKGLELDISKEDTKELVNKLIDNRIRGVQTAVSIYASDIIFLFSGKTENNFRSKIATVKSYKGTRSYKDSIPNEGVFRKYVETYISTRYNYHKEPELEADDLCTMAHGKYTFIYSFDKDLRNSPGYHFDIKANIMVKVSPDDGFRALLRQAMTGDSTDNIPGAFKIGKVTAGKIIPDDLELEDAITNTIATFQREGEHIKDSFDRFIEMYSLVNLRTGKGDWEKEKYKNFFDKIDRLIEEDDRREPDFI